MFIKVILLDLRFHLINQQTVSKFNEKKKPVVPTTVNLMGEKAYALSAKEELVATVLTTFLQASYYESEEGIVNRILDAVGKCDSTFVAKLAIYARRDANMRSVTHLLAGSLAHPLSGSEIGKRFYRKIVQRPDDMSEILAYIKHRSSPKSKFKIPNHIKKGFRSYLESMDPYQIDKYKMKGKDISLVDLVNLFHPKPTKVNEEAYRRLINGKSLDGLYTSSILEKTMSKAGQVAKEERLSDEAKEELKAEAIAEVLDGGMPMMNLVRNLRNIITKAPKEVPKAIAQLTTKDKVLNSKLLPFRFATAYKEVEALKSTDVISRGAVKFEKSNESDTNILVHNTLSALEVAISYSISNIPKLTGNTAILIDHSGSMGGYGVGESLVSAMSSVTTSVIADTFASMMIFSQDNVYVGLFGDRLIPMTVDRSMGPLKTARFINTEGAGCGSSTENGLYIFLNECIRHNTKVDNLIIFSDMVIGDGGKGGWDNSSNMGLGKFQDLFKKFKQVNPQCNTICVDLKQTKGTSVFDKSLNVTNVAGWSDKIFDVITSTSKGYSELIKIIEKIQI